ncbi:hypothetical protein [uncultured phage cr116_1]|uniref:Uncharacterized protein n=1 Tax=uncultured phage cr116_1 TaxID=2772073 RepID=A0A7M1S0T8_9CAUD|nr:hypothetical protein KNV40_gp014 [uncultured phage cr116_1]QOR59429.1 hypothetical protein [uncultured phage cr116_1]DAK53136.1 MAG TPA: hypothetical protein [Crassvirales sp.]
MIGLSIIAALLFVVMLIVVIKKCGIPEMVSSIYYLLGKSGWVFQVVMMAVGMLMLMCLLDCEKGVQCLAFLACGGLMFVGAAPRFMNEDRGVHKAAATICAMAGIGWCLSANFIITIAAIVAYMIGIAYIKGLRKYALFVAELMAIGWTFLTYWSISSGII